jgi:hypothetical protein
MDIADAAKEETKKKSSGMFTFPELPELDTTSLALGGLVAAGYYTSSKDVMTSALLGGAVYVGASLYQSKSENGKKEKNGKKKKGKKKRYSCGGGA